ncbi:MAG TPA: hypothetical protein VGL94_19175 [Ktedonobacteraceae bacterium]|jgi:hypothetical protein
MDYNRIRSEGDIKLAKLSIERENRRRLKLPDKTGIITQHIEEIFHEGV